MRHKVRKAYILPKDQIRLIAKETSNNMYIWVNQSTLPAYAEKWFIQARNEAFKSDFHTAKTGCVIVYKNHVIGRGHNKLKTDPYQKKYNQKYREWTNDIEFSKTCGHTIHAEIDALKHISYQCLQQHIVWKKVSVYIYRVAPGLECYSGLALPCPACAHALADVGIQGAYYTTGHVDKPFGYCDL